MGLPRLVSLEASLNDVICPINEMPNNSLLKYVLCEESRIAIHIINYIKKQKKTIKDAALIA